MLDIQKKFGFFWLQKKCKLKKFILTKIQFRKIASIIIDKEKFLEHEKKTKLILFSSIEIIFQVYQNNYTKNIIFLLCSLFFMIKNFNKEKYGHNSQKKRKFQISEFFLK